MLNSWFDHLLFILVEQSFSVVGKYVCRGLFFLIGDIFDCHHSGIGWGFAIGIQWVEATNAVRHPKVPRQAPSKELSGSKYQ